MLPTTKCTSARLLGLSGKFDLTTSHAATLRAAPKTEPKPIVLFVVPRRTHMVPFPILLHRNRCWNTQHQVNWSGDKSDVVPIPALMVPGVHYKVLKAGGWCHQLSHLSLPPPSLYCRLKNPSTDLRYTFTEFSSAATCPLPELVSDTIVRESLISTYRKSLRPGCTRSDTGFHVSLFFNMLATRRLQTFSASPRLTDVRILQPLHSRIY